MTWDCARTAVFGCLLCTFPALSQRLSDFTVPQPLPPGSVLIVGFLGGFEHWNDPQRGVRRLALELRESAMPNVYVETAGNHRRRTALKMIRRALDTNGDHRIDPHEAARANVILYGQSWGGGAVMKTARALNRLGVPVLLTVQVDSVGISDAVVPENVRAAANFYQHDLFTIRGESHIRAKDPSKTQIIGNFQLIYYFHPVDPEASWARRRLGGSHAKMEFDPMVWMQVGQLIRNAIP